MFCVELPNILSRWGKNYSIWNAHLRSELCPQVHFKACIGKKVQKRLSWTSLLQVVISTYDGIIRAYTYQCVHAHAHTFLSFPPFRSSWSLGKKEKPTRVSRDTDPFKMKCPGRVLEYTIRVFIWFRSSWIIWRKKSGDCLIQKILLSPLCRTREGEILFLYQCKACWDLRKKYLGSCLEDWMPNVLYPRNKW